MIWLAKEASKDPNTGRYGGVIMAFGSAVFAHNSRGSATCPIWAFRLELSRLSTLVLVNEYNTSKMCHRCRSWRVKGVSVPGERGQLHGVRYCGLCRLRINRDINAAKNMRYVFLYQLACGGERPLGYKPGKRVLAEAAIGPGLLKARAERLRWKANKAAEKEAQRNAAEQGASVAAEAEAGAAPSVPAAAPAERASEDKKRKRRRGRGKSSGSESSGDGEQRRPSIGPPSDHLWRRCL